MSKRQQLNVYIRQVQQRLRLDASLRGAAVIAGAALTATIVFTLILNAYAFPERGLTPARLALLAVVVAAVCFGLAWPLWRMTRAKSVGRAERGHPEFEQRLMTFAEKEAAADEQSGLFLELLAADTLKVAESEQAQPAGLVPQRRLGWLLGGAVVCAAVLVWLVAARPGFMGYGASLLWTGPHKDVPPIYLIKVSPGNAAVRRNSDQMVTAQVIGLTPEKVDLYARYGSASKWEPVAMQPAMGSGGYQFLFAGLPENVEYYVAAGAAQSKHYTFRVVDLPAVKQIQVTYHYPKWTGLQTVSEEHGGDLRALEGTDAELTVTMTSPLKDGMIVLDGGQPLKLAGGEGNKYTGTIHMDKDGAYHVAAVDEGQQVRLSEDYFISTSKANPPMVAIDRPTGDYRASPIEEVTVGVKAGADFGLTHVSLHYSVNGGPEQTVSILKLPGAKDAGGTTTLNLEDYKLAPGDVVSLYAIAKDAHAETKTEIGFIQVDPFEREFSQSQQSGGGGGGGGGGGQQGQTDIARREKELIEATWKQQNDKTASADKAAATGKLLAEAQMKLKEQAIALSMRMQSRDLSEANEEFNSFDKNMEIAAAGMQPAAEKLGAMQWQDAMPVEQKVLQALLRAEATLRKIEVAFGQRGSGAGGGGGGSAGRDLASLFDLEMDTEKNQYETAPTGSAKEQEEKKVDDALAKLDALAKRQDELAQKQGNQAQTFQQRWQQEMLRREAEQLQREMEQMPGQQGQSGQQGQQSASGQQQGQQGQQGQQSQSGQQGQSGQSQSGQAQGGQSQGGQSQGGQASGAQSASAGRPGTQDGAADPRVTQALQRLRAANDEMKRAGSQPGAQGSEEAKRAADRLREATDLLGGAQKQQASGRLDSLGRETDRLSKEEAAESARVSKLAAQGEEMAQRASSGKMPSQAEMQAAEKERDSLANDRQKMSGDLERLEKQLRDTARELAPTQPGAASNLRDALTGMDDTDLKNLVQRTADWLRQGVNPNSNGTEGTIATGLKKLDDQVRQAEQAAGSGEPGRGGKDGKDAGQGVQTAELDRLGRLRGQIESLRPGGGPQNGSQQGQQGRGQASGQQAGNQQSQRGQQGSTQQGQGQNGRGQQAGNQSGQGGNQAGNGAGQNGAQRGGARNGQIDGQRGGDIANGELRGGGGTDYANLNIDTGGQKYDTTRSPVAPRIGGNPADTQRVVDQGLGELNQLRQMAKGDPAAEKEIQEIMKEMQNLDPSRFPGNPAMVEELHTKVLNDVDKLELELRRSADQAQAGQVRTAAPANVPAGYEDAVAEYYRRLGKGQ
jgi:hypothetical protein